MVKIVDKYLTLEFLKPFFIAVFALTVIMISSYLFQLTDYIIIKGIPIKTVAKLLLYKLPTFVVQSLSMAVLFSTLLALSRLVKDSEFTALRMGGINFWRLLIPLVALGLLISGVTFMMNEHLVPWSTRKYRRIIRYEIKKGEKPEIYKRILFKESNGRYFYLGWINDRTKELKEVVVYNRRSKRVITALDGTFSDGHLYLKNGQIHNLDGNNYVAKVEEVNNLKFDLDKKLSSFYEEAKKPSEMNRSELKERMKLLKAGGIDTTKLAVQYHFNLAETFASLIFVLIGAPLSIKSNKGRIFGIIASVVIIFSYYVFLSIGRSLGRNDLLEPVVAAWLPNLTFALLGFYLIIKEDYFKLN